MLIVGKQDIALATKMHLEKKEFARVCVMLLRCNISSHILSALYIWWNTLQFITCLDSLECETNDDCFGADGTRGADFCEPTIKKCVGTKDF